MDKLLNWLFRWRRDPLTSVIIAVLWAALGIFGLEGKRPWAGWAFLAGAIIFLIVGITGRITQGTWKPVTEEDDDRGTGLDR